MKKLLFLSAVAVMPFLFSCKKRDDSIAAMQIPPDVPGDSVTIDSQPLHVGNKWTYSVKSQSSDNNVLSAVQTAEYTVTITKDTVINGFHIYHASQSAYTLGDFSSYEEDSNYVQLASGLYLLPSLNNVNINYIQDSATLILPYPPDNWNLNYRISVYSYTINSQGYKEVTVPAGIFNCIKVNTHKIYNSSGASEDDNIIYYYSAWGLVQSVELGYNSYSAGHENTTFTKVTTLKSTNF